MGYSQAAIWGVSLSFPILGFLLVTVRFWMRRGFQKTSIGVDDWLILFASVLVLGMGANFIVGSYVGTMGMDGRETIQSHKSTQSKVDYATLVFEKPTYGAIKLSVLFFYRRIFTVKKFRIVNNWLIALIIVWTLAFFLGDILNCGAYPAANWNPEVKEKAHCDNLYAMLLVFAVTDVVTDIAIMWMPYPEIKNLHMDVKERWALAGIFLLGTIDLLIGIVRMSFIIANQTIPAVNTHFNPPESTAPTFWTVVEVGVGVIAANLPALAPLFKQRARLAIFSSVRSFRERLMSRSGKGTSRNDSASIDVQAMKNLSSDSEGSRAKSVQEQKDPSLGAWNQFERMDNLSAEELGTRRTLSRPML